MTRGSWQISVGWNTSVAMIVLVDQKEVKMMSGKYGLSEKVKEVCVTSSEDGMGQRSSTGRRDGYYPETFDARPCVGNCHAIDEDRVQSSTFPVHIVICSSCECFVDQELDFLTGVFVPYLDSLPDISPLSHP